MGKEIGGGNPVVPVHSVNYDVGSILSLSLLLLRYPLLQLSDLVILSLDY